jgi:hypothetical protein
MEITLWTITTCRPDDGTPLVHGVYGSEAEAIAAWDEQMRAEWAIIQPWPDEPDATGPMDYPGDPHLAHAIMDAYSEGEPIWGRYRYMSHTITIPHASVAGDA